MKKILFLIFLFLFFPTGALAITQPKISDEGYSAKFVSQSIVDPVEMEAGTTKTVKIKFKNTGQKTWQASSANYISAYTFEPRNRKSVFKSANWLSNIQTAKIAGEVKPGAIGELTIELKAPEKIGDYKEEFFLAAENKSWMKNGYFYLKIKVKAKTVATSTAPSAESSVKISAYKAEKIAVSKISVDAKGGEEIEVFFMIRNKGAEAWKNYALRLSGVSLTGMPVLSFADDSWQNNTLALQKNTTINSGAFFKDSFTFRAPKQKGNYTATFHFEADGRLVPEGDIKINLNVNEDAPADYVAPVIPVFQEIVRLTEEPKIRVGLWKMETEAIVFSNQDDYSVLMGENEIAVLPVGQEAVFSFQNGNYRIVFSGFEYASTEVIRIVPKNNPRAVFTVKNYLREVSWKGNKNFNAYRGGVELRSTESGIYLINELLLDDYVAGIAETSGNAPVEYVKAILTAARTYAYYIKEKTGKHEARGFDVVSNTGDQLYLGYVSEELMPKVAEAARETRGQMVVYDSDANLNTASDVVITPYFGNSDGRTRAWTEVWGGAAKPWLVPVTAKYDARDGKNLWGHGVGMSARDAALMADEEGKTWQEILKYYYTGVGIEKFYL